MASGATGRAVQHASGAPFQPLPPLRLAIAAGGTSDVVGRIFNFIYGRGRNVEGVAALELGRELGLDNLETRITDPQVKERLRQNTEEAISAGVFGVPSFVARGELFWGDDATDMLLDFIENPALFEDPEMVRLSNMPMGVRRVGG
jgi:predicted DsbA family dithiol-disulfide isomerase